MVTIAYWDTEGGSRPPRLLGEYKGTPTIKLFKPKRRQRKKGSSAEKDVVEYQHGERNAKDMRKFLEYQLPSFVERVKFGPDDLAKARSKADKYGLPVAVLFTSKASTSTTVKWLSVEFRRRMLLVEVPPTEKNKGIREALLEEFSAGTSADDSNSLPALYVIPPQEGPLSSETDKGTLQIYEGESFNRRKLQSFFDKTVLKKPVLEPLVKPEEDPQPKKKESVGGDEF